MLDKKWEVFEVLLIRSDRTWCITTLLIVFEERVGKDAALESMMMAKVITGSMR